jgi:hypothetical protein
VDIEAKRFDIPGLLDAISGYYGVDRGGGK